MIIYDITQNSSFYDVETWVKSIIKLSDRNKELFLIGTKADKTKERAVAKKLAMKFARANNLYFHEVSAKEPSLTNSLLDKITQSVLGRRNGSFLNPIKILPKEPNHEKSCAGCNIV